MKNTSSREHAEPLSLAQIFGHPEDVTEREYLNSILEGEGPWYDYFLNINGYNDYFFIRLV